MIYFLPVFKAINIIIYRALNLWEIKIIKFFSLCVLYGFALPVFAQEAIDLELSKLMEAQNVGESNINTRELYTMPTSNLGLRYLFNDLQYASDVHDVDYPRYRLYDASFLANGRQKSLVLGIEESEEYPSSEILQEVKSVLGEMPERWLSEVHFIMIKREMDPIKVYGEFKTFSEAFIPDCTECDWLRQVFPQLSPRVINNNYGGILFVHNTIQVNLYYSQDARESTSARAKATETMRHELGHLIARRPDYGYSSQEWYDAIVKDGTLNYDIGRRVSEYSDLDIEQDFAETVAIYLATYRGFSNDPYINEPEAATDNLHRFAILDRIMGINEMKNGLNVSQEH